MTSFNTTIYLNDIEYPAEIVGYHEKGQVGTWEDPPFSPRFTVEEIWITPANYVDSINLMSKTYNWLVSEALLESLEEDFFTLLKEEHYDPY
jgi:hypothetical protein